MTEWVEEASPFRERGRNVGRCFWCWWRGKRVCGVEDAVVLMGMGSLEGVVVVVGGFGPG